MPLNESHPWRPGLTSFSKFTANKEYCLIRQSGHDSHSKGPLYLLWEDCIVGAAIVNGHTTRAEIIEYANGYADKDPGIMEEALDRIEANVTLLRQFGWDVADCQPQATAPAAP